MSDMGVTIRYARALCEVAREHGVSTALTEDMRGLGRILAEAPGIREFCLETRHTPSECKEFVDLAFCPYVGELTQRTLRIAAENGRLAVIPHLPAAVERVQDEENGIERVVLETVQTADGLLLRHVSEHMQERIGKKIAVENRLNPRLLGGFRLLWQDRLLDYSTAGRLHALGRCLTAHV